MRGDTSNGVIVPLSKPDFVCLYENSLRCIDREDNLIHYRHSWALQINVALVALLFVQDKISLRISPEALIVIVSLVGAIFTSISFFAILAARKQLKHIRRRLEDAARAVEWPPILACDSTREDEFKNVITAQTGFPRPFGVQRSIWRIGDFSSLAYCGILVIFWVAIFIRNVA
jgi:hypothetical protein